MYGMVPSTSTKISSHDHATLCIWLYFVCSKHCSYLFYVNYHCDLGQDMELVSSLSCCCNRALCWYGMFSASPGYYYSDSDKPHMCLDPRHATLHRHILATTIRFIIPHPTRSLYKITKTCSEKSAHGCSCL